MNIVLLVLRNLRLRLRYRLRDARFAVSARLRTFEAQIAERCATVAREAEQDCRFVALKRRIVAERLAAERREKARIPALERRVLALERLLSVVLLEATKHETTVRVAEAAHRALAHGAVHRPAGSRLLSTAQLARAVRRWIRPRQIARERAVRRVRQLREVTE